MKFDAFDRMAAGGNLMGITMQIPGVIMAMVETLEECGEDATRGAAHRGMVRTWLEAAPESRSAILLSMAWSARETSLEGPDPWGYAGELHQYAREFDGDSEAFHGHSYPAMPLPGQAGALATSIGFDRDDAEVSLLAALLLLAAARRAERAGQ